MRRREELEPGLNLPQPMMRKSLLPVGVSRDPAIHRDSHREGPG